MNNCWSALIILLLGDPHLLEGGEGGQDGTSDPDRVLPLRWSNDLDLDGAWGQGGDLLLHPVSNTGVHGGTTGQDTVSVEILTNINITLHDGVEGSLMDTTGLHTKEGRLEESFWTPEPFVSYSDNLTVR